MSKERHEQIAFVLVKCTINYDEEVIEDIKKIGLVREISRVFGAYDLLVKITASEGEDIKLALSNLKRRPNISGTITLVVMNNQRSIKQVSLPQ